MGRFELSCKQGGLGDMDIPLLADKVMTISRAYGVLKVGKTLGVTISKATFGALKVGAMGRWEWPR
jgi:alkyl hydroperoxide reductase subunit AhpC